MSVNQKKGAWNFGGDVPKKFESHIGKSVPLYSEAHDLICKTSDFFLRDKSRLYDIGCSTGNLIGQICKNTNKKNLEIVGIDVEKKMIQFAKKNFSKSKMKKNSNKVSFLNKDITKFTMKKCDMITSLYTIQFIHSSKRQEIFNKIYNSLNWGGAFFYFEKVRGSDARFQDIMTSLYNDFKEDQNLSSEHIVQKSKSIRGVLDPYTEDANEKYLKRAGFADIQCLLHFICFKGYLCIK